jgi:phage terminase small subunit
MRTINPRQEVFCLNYTMSKAYRGNATRSYMEAYRVPEHRVGSAERTASRLLRNVEVLRRIKEILQAQIADIIVDVELARVILQNDDLGAKLGAINLYNKINGRI